MFGLILFAGLLYLWPGFVRYLEESEEPMDHGTQLFLFCCYLHRIKEREDRDTAYAHVFGEEL